jgi:hypothetical protein
LGCRDATTVVGDRARRGAEAERPPNVDGELIENIDYDR